MPAGQTGIHSLEDLRAQRQAGSAVAVGLDTINDVLQAELAYANQTLTEQLSDLVEDTTDTRRIYGTSGRIMPMEVDEFGVAPTKKILTGAEVAFPLRLYKQAVGWTTKFLEAASAAEVAEQYIKVRTGHALGVTRNLARALFFEENYTDFDILVHGKQVELTIRRLLNADGSPIPDSPAGVSFDPSTHTHYVARASTLAATDIDNLIKNVTEHGNTQGLRLYINVANAAAIRGLTAGFIGLRDAGIIYNVTDTTQIAEDFGDLENQRIGFWRNTSVEIWVKPWVPATYVLCFSAGAPEKVLCRRQSELESQRGLRLMSEFPTYPLRADNFEATYGFGVWNRTAAAVLYIGNTTWADPAIPSLNEG